MKKHYLSSRIYHPVSRPGATFMEILITLAVFTALSITVIITLNPWLQVNRGHDSRRKTNLATLKKVFEEFYNDTQCYPKPDEVCYQNQTSTSCPICGDKPTSPQLSTDYLPQLPCNPTRHYLYVVDSLTCPTWYRIYTQLDNPKDPAISEIGCLGGCPSSPTYNYGISSSNKSL